MDGDNDDNSIDGDNVDAGRKKTMTAYGATEKNSKELVKGTSFYSS